VDFSCVCAISLFTLSISFISSQAIFDMVLAFIISGILLPRAPDLVFKTVAFDLIYFHVIFLSGFSVSLARIAF
jgi:hypothetical protein